MDAPTTLENYDPDDLKFDCLAIQLGLHHADDNEAFITKNVLFIEIKPTLRTARVSTVLLYVLRKSSRCIA